MHTHYQTTKQPKIDTLIIIGNGFDIWQGLDTSYKKFEEYYQEHLDDILKKLHIKKQILYDKSGVPVLDAKGKSITVSDVELFFGNPFHPEKLPHEFWHTFEVSLDRLDDQELNLYFGKTRAGLKGIRKSAKNAVRILRKAFCDWIETIKIDEKDGGYDFGDNCLFINFNYTDTLLKRFGVDKRKEYHIHGEATDRESIIFGHASHPEYPLPELYSLGGRFRGLYYIEEALYKFDKHVDDNYMNLCLFFAAHATIVNDIKKIYVLGHSFASIDREYFRHIINATQKMKQESEAELTEEEKAYLDNLDFMGMTHLNIQYAIHHRERALGIKPIPYPELEQIEEKIFERIEDPYYRLASQSQLRLEKAAVYRRYMQEQAERDAYKMELFSKSMNRELRKERLPLAMERIETFLTEDGMLDETLLPDAGDVQWHISYYSQEDKARIDNEMRNMGCKNYTLYSSIDECISEFRK